MYNIIYFKIDIKYSDIIIYYYKYHKLLFKINFILNDYIAI